MPLLRTLLLLSRAGGLPAVWSNCLAGWWLAGHRETEGLPFLFVGATLMFIGGNFLNDAFDADYDREHRRARPIPSGTVAWKTVWRWGLALLAAGVLVLLGPGTLTASLGLALVVCIIAYNTIHQALALSPALLGACRLFLYLMGAAAAGHGVSGWSLWCGLAMAGYVSGVGCFKRWERTPALVNYWPVLLLAFPILLAAVMNAGGYLEKGLLLSAILALWGARALRQTFWSAERKVGVTVLELEAGIVFADWLACADAPRELSFTFLALFGVTLLCQRVLPRA